MKSFWQRLGKHIFNEMEAVIQRHNEVLDNLMQQFQDKMALTTIETVHRIVAWNTCLVLDGNPNTSSPPLSPLLSNFRIIVTSRPLKDIHNTLHAAPHIRHVSLDDVSSASTAHDIQLYIASSLKDLCPIFNDAHFKALALKSDSLFEWAL
ncbi:hypothetical protein BDR05DRAFT_1004398 [Suillus weaverae]|nr:hypothetical protein BDR05DRAFT_1004398 [Suillus weaverae]